MEKIDTIDKIGTIDTIDKNDDIQEAIGFAPPYYPSDQPELYCLMAKAMSYELPEHVSAALEQFASQGTTDGAQDGFLLFRTDSFDPDGLSPTPSDNGQRLGEQTQLAWVQSVLASCMGDLVAYEAEGGGGLFQDIVPSYGQRNKQTSLGSAELEIHTEQAFSYWRPDILSLACLRGDPTAWTYVLPVSKIIHKTTAEEQALLRQPLWTIGVDLSFDMGSTRRGPIPVLYGPEDDPTLVFDQDLMEGITEEAEALCRKIVAIYYAHRSALCLEPGDILFVDNRRAVHGRSSYQPRYDGEDRFLVRCFVSLDYEASHAVREGRMVRKQYS
jgi:L-asparagine oxygenase